jgi:plastocyanin
MSRKSRAAIAFTGAAILAAVAVTSLHFAVAEDEAVAEVEMTGDLQFSPARVHIPVGGTVVWTNTSDTVHTVTADPDLARRPGSVRLPDGAEPFDSGPVEAGGSYRHQFTTPGEYTYFCRPHEGADMIGHVVVER